MTASDQDPVDRAGNPPPAPDAEDGDASLAERLATAEALAEEHRNAYLRTAADLENYRRRAAREIDNARQFGVEGLAGSLLPVLDSLELGLAAADKADTKTLLEGQTATLRLLVKALESAGITEIDPLGQPFDPEQHEAMATQPSTEHAPDSVMAVLQKGYALKGRLLRPARVLVARATDA